MSFTTIGRFNQAGRIQTQTQTQGDTDTQGVGSTEMTTEEKQKKVDKLVKDFRMGKIKADVFRAALETLGINVTTSDGKSFEFEFNGKHYSVTSIVQVAKLTDVPKVSLREATFTNSTLVASGGPVDPNGGPTQDELEGCTEETEIEYDSEGRPSKETTTVKDKDGNVVYTIIAMHSYLDDGTHIINQVQRDANGNQMFRTETFLYSNGSSDILEYDKNDRLVTKVINLSGGRLHSITHYEYDESGGVISSVESFADDSVVKKYIDGNRIVNEAYDKNGTLRAKRIYDYNNNTMIHEKYDEKGELISRFTFRYTEPLPSTPEDSITLYWMTVSDDSGIYDIQSAVEDTPAVEEYYEDGKLSYILSYERDEEGNILKTTREDYDSEGRLVHSVTTDADGNKISERTITYHAPRRHVVETEYSYDVNGEVSDTKVIEYEEDM